MAEEITSEVPLEKPKRNWLKIGLMILGGLALIAVSAYAGYWYASRQQPIPTPTPTATTPTQIQYEDLSRPDSVKSLSCIVGREKEFVLNTQGEYQKLLDYKSPYFGCKDFTLPEIDFSQKTLLGKYTSGAGCSIDFVRKVYRDDSSKKIIYSIGVVEEGPCEKIEVSMNWILIPKIPSGYDVEFESLTDKVSCEELGGQWKVWRDVPNATPECNLPTSDVGKECTDSSQCESYCQAEKGAEIGSQASGKCYGWKIVICMQEVREGIVDTEWCH